MITLYEAYEMYDNHCLANYYHNNRIYTVKEK